jgi:integrase
LHKTCTFCTPHSGEGHIERHDILGGEAYVYKRNGSPYWQCYTYLAGRIWRTTTKEERLSHAKEFAEDWYLGLRGKKRSGEIKEGPTFSQVADKFQREYEAITQGHRSPKYIETHKIIINAHLKPFLGPLTLPEITPGKVQEYRVHRQTSRKNKDGEPIRPSRSTLHHETVTLRQILKMAQRDGLIQFVPDISPPYKASGKIGHRAWFSPDEYRQLYEATRRRAKKPLNNRWQEECQRLHDYVLFMANTGLRPDEAARLEYRDVSVEKDDGTAEELLVIEVRGKRGVGYCKSTANAVRPFMRLKERNNAKPTDRLFPSNQRELLNAILTEENLKKDRDGNRRTAYSLRHTYICLRLSEGADIYQIAKNCRTSVEMIEKHYAVHLKNTLDAGAINVRKSRKKKDEDNEE